VLVEQPGGWGADAIRDSALPPAVGDHLRTLSRSLPARVLLIRRVGGRYDEPPGRTVLVGISRVGGGGWLERIALDHIDDLLDLDLTGVSSGASVGGEPVTAPTYLVCTNGKHDVCCATYGLPVARALDGVLGDRVWECSHVGGDRFAGNLVCLPDGILYGHLDPVTAAAAVAAHEEGRVLTASCRGRSALTFVAQAAELLVRDRLELDGLDDLRYVDAHVDAHGDGADGSVHRVRFAVSDGREVTAMVRRDHDPVPRVLTCGTQPTAAPVHILLDLVVGTD
jgi:hypothetical protein